MKENKTHKNNETVVDDTSIPGTSQCSHLAFKFGEGLKREP